MLTTLTEPTSGQAGIDGLDVVNDAAAVRRAIGVTFQETVLDDALMARQVLEFHGRLYGLSPSERLRRADLTVKLTTHYLDEAQQLADQVGIIDGGASSRRALPTH